jgi:hypothetical protein
MNIGSELLLERELDNEAAFDEETRRGSQERFRMSRRFTSRQRRRKPTQFNGIHRRRVKKIRL